MAEPGRAPGPGGEPVGAPVGHGGELSADVGRLRRPAVPAARARRPRSPVRNRRDGRDVSSDGTGVLSLSLTSQILVHGLGDPVQQLEPVPVLQVPYANAVDEPAREREVAPRPAEL